MGIPPAIDDPRRPGQAEPVREPPMNEPPLVAKR